MQKNVLQIKAHLRLFNKKIQFFMGAKIYSQGAEIFAASCKNHFLQPRKKGLLALFIYPAKSDFFFFRLQIFLHAACNLLPPQALAPNAKNDECGY
jgi:hypothetical protein